MAHSGDLLLHSVFDTDQKTSMSRWHRVPKCFRINITTKLATAGPKRQNEERYSSVNRTYAIWLGVTRCALLSRMAIREEIKANKKEKPVLVASTRQKAWFVESLEIVKANIYRTVLYMAQAAVISGGE